MAGAISGSVTTPLDVAKSRMMVNTLKKNNLSLSQWIKLIYKEEGWKAVFKGVVPRTIMTGFGGAIYFGVFYGGLILAGVDSKFISIRQ